MSVEYRNELLSRAEAAEYLGVRATTLANWASAGRYDLPYHKAGRAVRYRRSDLDRWLDERRFLSTGEAAAAGT